MTLWLDPEPVGWNLVVDDALAEDVGYGDISGQAIPADHISKFMIEAQADGVVCGVGIAESILAPYAHEPSWCHFTPQVRDGDPIERGLLVIEGAIPTRRLLSSERTVLNFLMHLSGVATLTRQFVQRTEGTNATIVDTRKTLPGLRSMQKYAVRCGGGKNHRMGLYDGAMIKDNHIMAFGSITEAVRAVRQSISHMGKIEVECETPEQVSEAVRAGAEVIMLDNMDPFTMRDIVQRHRGQAIFEASGGISLDTVRGVAQTGVDLISVGAITHSAVSVPFHLELQ